MKLTDTFTFEAERGAVWAALMNPDVIAAALPGVDRLIPIEGEPMAWRAVTKLGISSVSGTYAGTVRMIDIEAPTRYTLVVSGEGQQSIINGKAVLTLSGDQPAQTILVWDAEVHLSGRMASLAQRLIAGAASLLSKQFFQGVARQLAAAEKQ